MESQETVDLEQTETSRIYPLVSERYKVVLVDTVVLIILAIVYSVVLDAMGDVPGWLRIACFASVFLYEPIAIAFFRGTVGHWMGDLKVVKESDEHSKIPIWLTLLRIIVKYLLGIISLFSISTENKGQAIHDMVSGSIVLFKDEVGRGE